MAKPLIQSRPTDLIIGRGIITAEAVASELRERLVAQLGSKLWTMPDLLMLAEARRILSQFEPILAEAIANTELAGWVAGFHDVAKQLPPHVESLFTRLIGGPPQPPEKILGGSFGGEDDEPIVRFPLIERAASSLFRRQVLARGQFDNADAATRANSFTVAGELSDGAIETIRNTLADTIQQGASLDAFRERLGPALETSFIGPGHLENVFRTNVNTAFHDGHDELASNPIVADVFPYQEYLAIHDARARHDHLALETLGIDGTGVYRRDDPFWDVFTPPWGYQCRCGINLLTAEAASRRGVREAAEWLRTGVKPPLVSRLPFISFRPLAGLGQRKVAA